MNTVSTPKPTIRIIAKNPKDNKKAKMMKIYVEAQWDKYGEIVEAISRARTFVDNAYGFETPDNIWDNIITKVVEKDISTLLEK